MTPSAPFVRVARLRNALLALALGLAAFASPVWGQTPGASYRPGEILIKFRPGASYRDRNAILADLGATRIRQLHQIGASYERLTGISVEQAVARYRGDSRVEFIEPNYIHHAFRTPNDPFFGQQWGLENAGQSGGTPGADIQATLAWDVFTGSSAVLVGVIDTGVDYTHQDLAANIFVNTAEVAGNGVDDDGNGFIDDVRGWDFLNDDNNPMDDHGHGTHCAGIIGAMGNNGAGAVGVNWSVRIMPLKFLSSQGFGNDADAISCIDYATRMGVRILSNSWGGGGYSQALFTAIQTAGSAGVLFVAAAGNASSNNDVIPEYPVGYDVPNILGVASSDHNDQLSGFSNYGSTSVDIAAPGSNIYSTLPGNNYGFLSGTSMAAPHVAGVAALVLGKFPGILGGEIKNLILAKAEPIPALSGLVLTGGRLSAFLPIADPDTLPPGTITDVSVVQVDGNWARLQWSATGDDGPTGRASRYEVRFSTAPITEGSFSLAQVAPNPPSPLPADGVEQLRIEHLAFSTPYCFALRAIDELGNAGGVSNNASATTLGPPDIAASPDSLTASLLTGGTATRTLTIQNTGVSELVFQVSVQPVTTQVATPRPWPALPIMDARAPPTAAIARSSTASSYSSGHTPLRAPVAAPSAGSTSGAAGGLKILLLRSGGDVGELQNLLLSFPDIDQVDIFEGELGTPTLAQLQGYGTVIAITDFPYADRVAVGNVLADYVDGGGGVVLTLATFIHDFEIRGRFLTGGYFPFKLGSGPAGSSNLGTYDPTHPIMEGVTTCAGELLGNVVVSPGANQVARWAIGYPLVATVGDHVAAVNLFFGADGFWGGDAPLLMRNAAFWTTGVENFLSVEPSSGLVPPGSSVQVEVTFDATGFDGGDHRASLEVASNDPDEMPVVVPVHLHVTGAPDVQVSPTSLDFGQAFVGFSRPETLTVRNVGTDLLTVTGVSATPAGYSVPSAGFTLPPGASRGLVVTLTPPAVGAIPGSLQLTSNDPDEGVVNVALIGAGVMPPDIAVTPEALGVALVTGTTTTRPLTIHGGGGSNLSFSVSEAAVVGDGPTARAPAGWLRVSPPAGASRPVASFAGTDSRGSTTVAEVADRTSTGTPRAVDVRSLASRSPSRPSAGAGTLVISTTGIGESIERALQELGHAYDLLFTDNFTTIDFTPYDTILVTLDGGAVTEASCLALANAVSTGRLLFMVGGTNYPTYYTGLQSHLLGHTNQRGWAISAPPHLTVIDPLDPLSDGLPPSVTYGDPFTSFYLLRINDPAAVVAAMNGDGHPALVHKPIGNGRLVYFINPPDQDFWTIEVDYQILKSVMRNVFAFGSAPWLSVDPRSGVVPVGGDALLQVELDATGLDAGDYHAEIQIASNDPDESLVVVPVHLHVNGGPVVPPNIGVSPPALFAVLGSGQQEAQSLEVSNTGSGPLHWSLTIQSGPPAPSSAPTWLRVTPTSDSLTAGHSRTLDVVFDATGLAPGTSHEAVIHFVSDDPDEPLVSVAATLVVTGPTATEISLVSSTVEPGRVRITWYATEVSLPVAIERSTSDGEWAQVGSVTTAHDGYLVFEDQSVIPGTRYGYRVVVVDGGAERYLGETWVVLPERAVLALHGLASDPASPDLSIAFSLPTAGPATLELIDLAGRCLRAIDAGSFGAGRHVASLGRSRAYPSGIYLIRLRHAEGTRVVKCAVVR